MRYYEIPFFAMGTRCVLEFYSETRQCAKDAHKKLTDEVDRIEQKYSRYRPTSFLSAINQAAADGTSITVDDETASLIDYAFQCHKISDGLFDITSGLLRQAWDFRRKKLPSQETIDQLLTRIGLDKVIWEKPVLHFPVKGMEMDFGGICKEYAADLAASLYNEVGIKHGVVELGGDVSVMGPRPDGSPWPVDIIIPNVTLDEDIAYVLRGAMTGSGHSMRGFTLNGKRYGHILNPLTGWPVEGLSNVIVYSKHCMIAGSFSSIAMLKGKDGIAWLDSYNVPYLCVDDNGKVTSTINGILPI